MWSITNVWIISENYLKFIFNRKTYSNNIQKVRRYNSVYWWSMKIVLIVYEIYKKLVSIVYESLYFVELKIYVYVEIIIYILYRNYILFV